MMANDIGEKIRVVKFPDEKAHGKCAGFAAIKMLSKLHAAGLLILSM